uniref:LAM_G_DOMAIN domain-containing protein n=1 Tax=Echinostoma caproni TaxID=27848 RepID=A0A183B3P8_9TREM
LRLDLPGRAVQTAVDEVRLRFRTKEVNGLLLYGDSSQHDYFCVELYRGRLRVNINLGTLPWSDEPTDNTVDAGSLLDDDQWHDVHIIRQEKNLNISVDRIHWTDPQAALQAMRWDEALGYPSRNPFLWWGPPITQSQLNITGFAIGGSGILGTTCPPVTTDDTVIMFPQTQQYVVFLKIERDGGTNTLQFGFQFRTLNRGGVMFYHTVDKDINFISVSVVYYIGV